jgi:prepilin-type N-terminal cleavage/methylation domain-containing protein
MNCELKTKRRGFISEHSEATKSLSGAKGFTLIELLVVITIIGLLSSVGLASYTRAQERARDAKRQSDLTSLRNSLEIYYAENNAYVDTSGSWQDIDDSLDVLMPIYTKVLPADPKKDRVYRYRSVTNQGYCLEAILETATETQTTCDAAVSLETDYNFGIGNP